MQPEAVRLNKYLALQLGVSRRQADIYIEKGRVQVAGVAAVLGQRIDPNQTDQVTLDSKPVKTDTKFRYVLFNKPVDYVCSRKQQGDSPTIYAILPADFQALKPVGRLDRNSSGLLMLTNDGDYAHKMTHPSFYKIKIYEVELDSDLAPLHQQMINDHGITLEDGLSQLTLERLSDDQRRSWRVTMSQGRNRQIRRTFDSLGYTVVKLHRTNFGEYAVDDIKPGDYKTIDIS